MTSEVLILTEVGVSTVLTSTVATSVNAEPLLTALIGLGISLITVVGGELVKFLVAYLKDKREDIENKNKDDKSKED